MPTPHDHIDELDATNGEQVRVASAAPHSGKLADEYAIYSTHARALGWAVKSFDEWLNS